MADENKPTPQQSQEAVQLDSFTSLQQPTESDQAGSASTAEVRADAVVTQPNTNAPEGPSFYLPNTDLTNAPPVQTGDSTVSETETEDNARPSNIENVEDALAGEGLLTVTVADTPETQAASSESGEGNRSPDVMNSSSGPSAQGPTNTPRAGTTQARAEVPLDGTEPAVVNEPAPVIESVTPVAATQPIELTVVPQVTEAVVTEPIAPEVATPPVTEEIVVPGSVASLSSAAVALTESNAPLSTSGTLVVTDADATAATVVAQTDTAGTYGKFSIGTDGAWTYTTNDAVNQLNANQVVTETFTVATSDGGTASVTVNITGTNDAPVAVDDSITVVEDTTSGALNLLGNDTDVEGTAGLSVVSIGGTTLTPGSAQSIAVSNGMVNVSAEGVITFTPAANYNGPVSFDYIVSDGSAAQDTATVNIMVTAVDDASVMVADTNTVNEDNAAMGNVLSNDGDVDNALSVTSFTVGSTTVTAGSPLVMANVGTLTIGSNGAYTFTPVANWNGTVPQVTYTTNTGSTSTLSIAVTPVDDASVITGTITGSVIESSAISLGTPVATGSLFITDVDSVTTFTAVPALSPSLGGYGTYEVSSNGTWTYTVNNNNSAVNALNTGQTLTDTFVVSTSDGTQKTVSVTINGSSPDATTGADTIVGTSGADFIDGGTGGDTLTGQGGSDVFVVSQNISFGSNINSGSISDFDIVTDFNPNVDQIKLPFNVVVATNTSAPTIGNPSTFRVSGSNVISAHSISGGDVTFYSVKSGPKGSTVFTEVVMNSASDVAAGVQYLSRNDIGSAGTTVSFDTGLLASGSLFKNYIYQQSADGVPNGAATLVEIHVANPYTISATSNSQFITPIALDLNQDGVTYIDRSQGVTYDYANDGSAVSTAWVESSDGLLAVQTDDGKLNVVFSTQEGETDLEGLAKVYDTNKDGVFDSKDENFDKFGVWQDANSDGVVQSGEFKTLDEAGIVSLSLESSGEQFVAANGDVIVYGQSSFTTKDGVTHILEDAGFATTTGSQMIGTVSNTEPALIATVAATTEGQESLLGYSVVATLENTDAKVGDEISLVINDGAITISHTLTAEDLANRRYEFRMSDQVIVTDVTNVVGVNLGSAGSAISSYANPVSVPYTLLAPAAYVEAPVLEDSSRSATESVSQPLQFSVLVSEILVESEAGKTAVNPEEFVVSHGTVSSVTMVNHTHVTLEVISDGRSPLTEVTLEVPQPEAPALESLPALSELSDESTVMTQPLDTADFMLLELGGVTYVIDTANTNTGEVSATDDYALTNSLSSPLVAGSWTEVVAGTEPMVEPIEPVEPANPLTDTSSPPMINTEVLDDPRLTDNGSWTP